MRRPRCWSKRGTPGSMGCLCICPMVLALRLRCNGDRVVVPTHICCGFCYNCVRGYSSSCLITNPGSAGAAYGYPGMGTYRGTQTESVRVPFADANCLRLPGAPGDQW